MVITELVNKSLDRPLKRSEHQSTNHQDLGTEKYPVP